MLRNKMKNKLVLFSFLVISSITPLTGCGTLNNPFLPTAELSVTDISSTDTAKGVSILQTFQRSGNTLTSQYKFNDPVVTIENKSGLPRVIFKQMITQFTLAGNKLPAETKPIVITVP